MKRTLTISMISILTLLMTTGCEDWFDVSSDRLVAEQDYGLNTAADSIFSMFGLFTQLQKLADSYVLLGELRGELLDVSESSDQYLREIHQLDIREGNPYVNIRDYYAVINNCNYILANLDTAAVDRGQLLKRGQYAAVQSIRAWTYMQLALNFKTVKYYEHPILTVADAEQQFEEIDFQTLASRLIPLLEPVQEVPLPVLGYIESYNANFSLIPVKVVLGDLYLWNGEYEKAATAYRGVLFDKRIAVDRNNSSYWIPVNNTISPNAFLYWNRALTLGSNEVISTLMSPTQYGQNFHLDTLNNHGKIVPSDVSIQNWNNQFYFLNEASSTMGDLRRFGSVSYDENTNREATTNYNFSGIRSDKQLIYKYKVYNQNVVIYRSSLVYLRYAEAVNRLNKPNLAFAVLKFGLNSINMFTERIVPARERDTPLPVYMQFSDVRFQNNAGIRMRGLGNVHQDTTYYKIPLLPEMIDSVRYVEDLIQQELALETAFEGNRFHDLMRITMRRMNDGDRSDDASYLADKVAAKHRENGATIREKLMNTDNWFIRW